MNSVLKVDSGFFTNYEAEKANWNGGTIDSNHPGYIGIGFWANVGTVGNSLQFTVNSETG